MIPTQKDCTEERDGSNNGGGVSCFAEVAADSINVEVLVDAMTAQINVDGRQVSEAGDGV